MKYENIKNYKSEDFRRLTGVKPETFAVMIMVANFWLRSGDAHTANSFKAFLEETLSFFENRKIGLLRLDSGLFSRDIFDCLEEEDRKTDCITAVPMYVNVQRKIRGQRTCFKDRKRY